MVILLDAGFFQPIHLFLYFLFSLFRFPTDLHGSFELPCIFCHAETSSFIIVAPPMQLVLQVGKDAGTKGLHTYVGGNKKKKGEGEKSELGIQEKECVQFNNILAAFLGNLHKQY